MRAWREILRLSAEYLREKNVPDAAVAAELLMARLLGCGRGLLAPHLDKEPAPRHVEAMRRALGRLAAGEPVQYVLGEWDFRSLTLTCDKRALIPRPETEELVTRVLAFLRGRAWETPPLVVDVGTGSGCILLALAKEFAGDARFLGTDISEDAVALARENAARCGLEGRVTFAVADGLDDFDEPEMIDVLVSNPPYIPSDVCATLDARVRAWEPGRALDGGPDGLYFYRRYIDAAFNILKRGGGVFFEIGDGQGEALRKYLFEMGFDDIRIEKDYAGHDRYASAVLPCATDV